MDNINYGLDQKETIARLEEMINNLRPFPAIAFELHRKFEHGGEMKGRFFACKICEKLETGIFTSKLM